MTCSASIRRSGQNATPFCGRSRIPWHETLDGSRPADATCGDAAYRGFLLAAGFPARGRFERLRNWKARSDGGIGDGRSRLYRQPHGLGLLDAGEQRRRARQAVHRLRLGRRAARRRCRQGDIADEALVGQIIATMASTRSSTSPVRSSCRNRSPIRSAITRTTPSRPAR